MGLFVQWILRQPAPGILAGPLILTPPDVISDQLLQGLVQRLAQLLGQEKLPVVEFVAVRQGEPRQELVPVQLHRLLKVFDAICAQLIPLLPMRFDLLHLFLEIHYINPDLCLWIDPHLEAFDSQHFFPECRFQPRKVAP